MLNVLMYWRRAIKRLKIGRLKDVYIGVISKQLFKRFSGI